MKKELLYTEYNARKEAIKSRLNNFKSLSEKEQFYEFLFCLLTPQSNAKKCWEAVEQLKISPMNKESILSILKSRTRFHNNKTRYIIEAEKTWQNVLKNMNGSNRKELRNWLAENVNGYGLKEAGHFLRNIGKSDNQVAVLDRHILRNLHDLDIISQNDLKIRNKKHYFELEEKFIQFSKEINIPMDELDLLFWSQETGEIFK